jgi:hypothetical protein
MREQPATISWSASAQNKQDQRQKRKNHLDVLAIDLMAKDEKVRNLVFH